MKDITSQTFATKRASGGGSMTPMKAWYGLNMCLTYTYAYVAHANYYFRSLKISRYEPVAARSLATCCSTFEIVDLTKRTTKKTSNVNALLAKTPTRQRRKAPCAPSSRFLVVLSSHDPSMPHWFVVCRVSGVFICVGIQVRKEHKRRSKQLYIIK